MPKSIRGGGIIKLFEIDPPEKDTDVYCSNFYQLKAFNGCAYDCQWCVDPMTRIMMADLSWKIMEDIKVGDKIIGLEKQKKTWKIVITDVQAKRTVTKERMLLMSERGSIITTPDHKFLCNSSRWTKAGNIPSGKMKLNYFVQPSLRAQENDDYMFGYLQGITDGDGTIGQYTYNDQTQYKYRLAMADGQAINRAYRYFKHFGIEMNLFEHTAGSGSILEAIRKDGKYNHEKIMGILTTKRASKEFHCGYVAGMFDSEGSHSGSTLRIPNTSERIRSKLTFSLQCLRIKYKLETFKCQSWWSIRIIGGTKKYAEVFNMINSAISRKLKIINNTTRLDLIDSLVTSKPLGPGPLYDIQTGTENFIAEGFIAHNCYLNGTMKFRPMGKAPYIKDMKRIVRDINEGLPKIRPAQLFNCGELADGQAFPSDLLHPIIPLFKKYYDKTGHKLLIVTKNDTKKVMSGANAQRCVVFSYSVNADYVARRWELRAPEVMDRIAAARQAADLGYEVRFRIDPMVPVIDWKVGYRKLVDTLMDRVPHATVITLGSLRGLNRTLQMCKELKLDTSWTDYLDMSKTSSWGKKAPLEERVQMYTFIIDRLLERGYKGKISLCKETPIAWRELGLRWQDTKCNCML